MSYSGINWYAADNFRKKFIYLFALGVLTTLMFLVVRLAEFWRTADVLLGFELHRIINVFLTGLIFDIAITAYILFLPTLILFLPLPTVVNRWRRHIMGAILIVIFIPSFSLSWIDIELARYTHKKLYFQDLAILKEGRMSLDIVLKQHAPIFIGWLISTALWVVGVIFILKKKLVERHLVEKKVFLKEIILLIFILAMCLGSLIFSWDRRPLNLVHSDSDPHLKIWSLNSPYLILRTITEETIKEKKWFDRDSKWKKNLNHFVTKNSNKNLIAVRSAFETNLLLVSKVPQNVVVIIMESLYAGFLGKDNPAGNIVPFINELAERSLFFPTAIANARVSIEGNAAVLGGIPALGPVAFLNSRYTTINFNGLGQQLSQAGYQTAFFHGAKRHSFQIGFLSKLAGFQKHFAKEDYPYSKDDDGTWGIYDGPFFQHMIEEIDRIHVPKSTWSNGEKFAVNKLTFKPKPFAAALFTLSAHHPFKIPDDNKNGLPDNADPMLRSQNYVDSAIRDFFKVAQTKPWYNDTLFVITADHTNAPYLEAFKNDPLRPWLVPILFFHPRMHWPKIDTNSIAQQIDIIPSITDFLGIKTEKNNLLSRSVFMPGPRIGFVRESTGFYFADRNQALFFPHDETLQPKLVQRTIEPDQGKKVNEFTAEELLLRGKAAVQYFNEGMVNNQLVQ